MLDGINWIVGRPVQWPPSHGPLTTLVPFSQERRHDLPLPVPAPQPVRQELLQQAAQDLRRTLPRRQPGPAGSRFVSTIQRSPKIVLDGVWPLRE